jgi:hypothetical protein
MMAIGKVFMTFPPGVFCICYCLPEKKQSSCQNRYSDPATACKIINKLK